MTQWQRLSTIDQFTAHLRAGLLSGHWTGAMPGVHYLAAEFGLNRKTVQAALQRLEQEGLLVGQGAGRKRKIVLPKGHAPSALRVAVLFYESGDETHGLFIRFQNRLKAAGHTVVHAPKSLTEIGGNTRRLARMVKDAGADAWVVIAGSEEMLQFFEQRQIPTFALFGIQSRLRIAGTGPDLEPAIVAATRRLIALGHRRIVLLGSQITLANPMGFIGAFLDELAAHGIDAGQYNAPGWEGGYDGLYQRLESLFTSTPPTAIILFSTEHYFATIQFLINRGLRMPQDISLACMQKSPHFQRFQPPISHANWNDQLIVRRIVRWAKNISQGKEDIRQTRIDSEFIEAGTVGPAPE